MDRREVLSNLAAWSGAALSVAGLTGSATGCTGHRASSTPSVYADYANYADYFDYADYVNYSDYYDGYYINYADYANYANYGDYFDYADAYSDYYWDYSNYANYMDYYNYSDYCDYYDYVKYNDYSDYCDYADTYADADGSGTGQSMSKLGRARIAKPRAGMESRLPKGGQEAQRGSEWRDPPEQVGRSQGKAPEERRNSRLESRPEKSPGLRGTARQGAPDELIRPERQKPGRRSRRMDGDPRPKAPPTRADAKAPQASVLPTESPDPRSERE